MASINYTSEQQGQIDALKSYVNEYCESHNIDPEVYTKYLDNQQSIDPALLNDPIFQAYWKVTYLQLMEVINPELLQSISGEAGEINFDEVYAHAGDDINNFIMQLVSDDPELMAFAAASDQNAATDPNFIRTLLEGPSGGDPAVYVDEEARRMAQEWQLGGMFDSLISQEEQNKTAQNHLLMGLAEMDQQYAQLTEALSNGDMSAQPKLTQLAQNRELYLQMIQKLEESLSTILALFSQLLKSISESQRSIINNIRGSS